MITADARQSNNERHTIQRNTKQETDWKTVII